MLIMKMLFLKYNQNKIITTTKSVILLLRWIFYKGKFAPFIIIQFWIFWYQLFIIKMLKIKFVRNSKCYCRIMRILDLWESTVPSVQSTLLHKDLVEQQYHCGRCRIPTRDLSPTHLMSYQWATTSPMSYLVKQIKLSRPSLQIYT